MKCYWVLARWDELVVGFAREKPVDGIHSVGNLLMECFWWDNTVCWACGGIHRTKGPINGVHSARKPSDGMFFGAYMLGELLVEFVRERSFDGIHNAGEPFNKMFLIG